MPTLNRVLWRLPGSLPVLLKVALPQNSIRLEALDEAGGGIEVIVEAEAPFALEIETGFVTYVEQVPAGRTRYLLTHLDRTDVRQM